MGGGAQGVDLESVLLPEMWALRPLHSCSFGVGWCSGLDDFELGYGDHELESHNDCNIQPPEQTRCLVALDSHHLDSHVLSTYNISHNDVDPPQHTELAQATGACNRCGFRSMVTTSKFKIT
jgi:hypothetical protein